ncbi:MAG: T9SS type A sorting domain-containing protein [Ignavibacteriaceae bacterium]|nr:T9SS type A sorting domain-containing protein [Ignavibacteriaceae bacterium]
MKKHILFFVIVFLYNSLNFAQWVSLDKNSLPDSKPNVQLISDDITGTVIKVDLTGFQIKEFNVNGKVFHSIDLGSLGITNEVGMPEIPHIAKILAIPDQGTVSVEVIEVSKSQIIKGINIPPARESWSEGKPETPFLENDLVYGSENLYPNELVKVEQPVIFRDFRIARVSIFPIRYSPVRQEIKAITSITVRIKYGGGSGINPKLSLKKPIAPSFDRIYKSCIFNYKEVLQREYNGDVTGYDHMLCIMPDSFVTSFQSYADWNHKTGTYINVIKFSDIGATGTNPVPIKNYINTAYITWPHPPTHVLLIGDNGVAPHQNITMDGWTFAYDDYFVELTGNDYFPEMMIGRWTNQASAKLRNIRNKLMNYEKAPYLGDPDWFRKALVCSNDAYPSQADTKRFTAQKMLTSGNFISVDSMYNGYPCPGNVTTISNMINAGRGWINYRGEGWYTQWWADCFPFSTTQVNALNNGAKSTFVTSIGCGVANWVANTNNNFGEAWLEIGDENNPKGACGFIGPTSNTHTAYNNWLDKGIYIGMFDEGLGSPGEALLRGKFYMYEVFGGADYFVGYHYRIYNILGDPSLHIWKDTPRNITVNYTDTVGVGSSQVSLLVTESGTGAPIADALVCISGPNIYLVETTLANGTAIINLSTQTTGDLNITVSGGRAIPFEGIIKVIEAATTFQFSVNVSSGWNMVSIPGLHPTNQNVDTWWAFRDPGANVFRYSGGYQPITDAVPGIGYWMKHAGARTYNTGDEWPASGIIIVPHNQIAGASGWNLFGGYELSVTATNVTTNPPGLQSGPIYKYSGGYAVANTIDPGYGYWIKLNSAGHIIIPETMAKGSAKEYFPESWGRIIISDATGTNYSLYSVKGDVDLSQYELPPAPPAGMFDIRYNSGKIAEDLNSAIKTIDLNGVTYPLTVRVEGMDIRLMDETGKSINVNLKAGEDVVISDASVMKLMVSGELIPANYALEQNYPNPFNPSTVIEFSLPEDVANVKLSIYNALGEKVAELVNTSLTAGKYQYQWNAQSVATGMYIYELRTEKFNAIKKMILLK